MNGEQIFLALFLASVVGGSAYLLSVRDLIRRGRLHRRAEDMLRDGTAEALPDGRVPCPECAEAVLPAAQRCPYCRSEIVSLRNITRRV